jgi:type II secretory pathway component PulL
MRSKAGRARFFQLSPEERQSFQRNAERWLQMKPEQQKILREREQQRLQKMRLEADAAMHQSGLRLDGPARDQFEARYLQERRRIERQLRQEYEQQLPQLNERLKSEFQSNQNGSPGNPSPPGSGKNRD